MAVYGTERREGQSIEKKCHFTNDSLCKYIVYSYISLFLQAHSGLMKPSNDLLPL